jgi:hypothetical protein
MNQHVLIEVPLVSECFGTQLTCVLVPLVSECFSTHPTRVLTLHLASSPLSTSRRVHTLAQYQAHGTRMSGPEPDVQVGLTSMKSNMFGVVAVYSALAMTYRLFFLLMPSSETMSENITLIF